MTELEREIDELKQMKSVEHSYVRRIRDHISVGDLERYERRESALQHAIEALEKEAAKCKT